MKLKPANGAGFSEFYEVAGTVSGQTTSGMSDKRILNMPRTGALELTGYIPGELHVNPSGCYIDYYVLHPKTRASVRKRIKVNKVPPGRTREVYARHVLRELNEKLIRGWNPFIQDDAPKGLTALGEALDVWLDVKSRNLRHSSPLSYTSFTGVFRRWCGQEKLLAMPVVNFTRNHAIGFLTYVSDVRKVSNTTYNNYLIFFSMLAKWFMERGYRTDNPFAGFARRKEQQKMRSYLTEEERVEMAEWIREHNPTFWLPCLFIYGALVRPAELRRLRVQDVRLDDQVVYLSPDVTKNGEERMPAIPDWMMVELHAMDLHKQPGNAWLVGDEIVPGGKPSSKHSLMRHWQRMAKALGWPKSKQFYSLRDTGIIQLIRDGVDLLHVKQQAGHKDLATTNNYVRHAFPKGPKEVREKSTSLQASSPLVMGRPLFEAAANGGHNAVPRFAEMERDGR